MSVTVMVIDDSMAVRKQVSRALTHAGFMVVEAIDGIDALEKLAVTPDVALLLCDLHMPRMGGMELLEKKFADPRYAPIPTLILTTEGQADLVQRAKTLGAKGWMVKPFDQTLLVAAVQKLTARAAA